MRTRHPIRRWAARGSTAALAAVALGAGMQVAVTGAQASAAGHPAVRNPYSPAYHHPYRQGVIPTRPQLTKMRTWARSHPPSAAAASPNNLSYGGGINGIGVTTGHEKVYLVFYGSQWGTQGTDANGNVTLSGDPSGEAPYLQQMFKGLGTNSERWSGVMTQYCQGVAVGSQSCPPSNTRHVAYPTGGTLAGVWVDRSARSPSQATPLQLGTEAVRAAAHFGNTTAAANRNSQYFVISPPGTHPDGFGTPNGQFCAWHDWNGDTFLSGGPVTSPDGDIAFTNMPYVTDVGINCGANFVRSGSAGHLDGVSIVEGHEYAETITDQNPPGGWIDSMGMENADKCTWKQTGAGQVAVLHLPTGAFAMQGSWANNANSGTGGCRFTQTIKSTQLLRNPGFETGTLAPWTATSGVLKKKSSTYPAHSGSWLARLGGRTAPHTDTLAQVVTVAPTNGTYGAATFSFWLRIKTSDPANKAYDKLTVRVLDASGTVLKKTLHVYSNLNAVSHYVHHSFSLNSFLGQTITVKFTGSQTLSGRRTSFFIDDTALNAS
jgi:serine protease